ncbi:hypothetical protein [Curtobacterium sp. Leaf261]|uniref:hypothetical protein n=1 Tax=Curtobacterium sp. Leaf261 TaxID=1736311 RepID=UPI0007015559|nr:hypothetical protein [Curtobacterium sp. Leaf261]KQO61479.1 hypothetical protein ASF23_13565 [Curtobacterium sp. Leaf261]
MNDDTTTDPGLRVFATIDSHDGKVSRRVEVLPVDPPSTPDGRYDGMVVVRGEHPTGALDPQPVDDADASLVRGAWSIGYAAPADLHDWYRPDRVVVPHAEARVSGLTAGTFADTRTRGRVRIDGREAHIAPDGRPAFRTLVGSDDVRVDVPLPRDEVVRLVEIDTEATTDTGAAGVMVRSVPVLPILPPGEHPDRSSDVVGLPPRDTGTRVAVRASWIVRGERVAIVRVDAEANTAWIGRPGQEPTPIAANVIDADLVRYEVSPA